ncbi:hypothetical protein SAMN04487981_106400 [Streptomyces sp. cf386]|uniref:hypothetical protein n=1 Tax=Streptomyces sp. cf386 TaxID=1761904 RepID=UPI00087FA46F|nr:hypothetical protein [Streptomyces sp. cf386]SDN75235.1 hypothetical protein SAMN04487981_106400 [Streptomyces sp. cf386]
MPHPIVVLRWLRAGVLGMVAVTALLYLVVADRAGEQMAAADRTREAIRDLGEARESAVAAKDELEKADAATDEVDLIGTGTSFANATTRVSTLLTSATEGNAAGEQGLHHIQFVQGQLTTSVQLANGPQGPRTALPSLEDGPEKDDRGRDVRFTGGLIESLEDLREIEVLALDEQLRSRWLDPYLLWPVLIGPVVVMLLLAGTTGFVVARHFRQYPSPALGLALLATASVALIACGDPLLPGRGWVMAIALPLLLAAGALAYLAYRPRIAEYRFPHS